MIGRLLLTIGSVAAATGLTMYGVATSFSSYDQDMGDYSIYATVGGTVIGIVGWVMYRADEAHG